MTAKSVLVRPKACAPGRVPPLDPPATPLMQHRSGLRKILYCSTSRRLNAVVRSLPSYERWAEMARQLPRGVRPSGRPQSSGKILSFKAYHKKLT